MTVFRVLIAATIASLAVGCSEKEKADAPKTAEVPDDGVTHGLTEEQANEVLAKVGDRVITVGEFADRLASQSPYLRARFESPERRKDFLNDLIRFELLVYEAKRRGYGEKPEVVRARRHSVVQQLIKKEIDEKLQLSSIPDEEIKKAYDSNPDEYNRPAQRRVSHILSKDKAGAQKLLGQAKEAGSVEAFRKLAREHTEDEKTKPSGGDLQFFNQNKGDGPDQAIRDAAFTMAKVTTVYPELVKTDAGYHVLMLTGKRAALTRTYDQAKRAIRHKIVREKKDAAMKTLLADLRKDIPVKIDEAALKDIKIEPGTTPKRQP